ncbi:efflux RND transporter permease subunit, partial [Wenyingzhuangia heitensis]|uniref:efflux RND transporter permease subunit n=1 Tax=Wenyingzhuangia heitensis TaxID=1487859 RepID=UPI001421622B
VFYISTTLKKERSSKNVRNKDLFPVSQEFVEFSSFNNQIIKNRIEQISEVAMVDVSGLVAPEILVIPDLQKLYSLQISLDDLENYIQRGDISIKNLSIKDSQYQYNIRLGSQLKNIKDVENIYIKKENRVYQLKDIATVLEHPKKRKGLVLSNGKEAITMAVIKQHDAKMGVLKDKLNELLEQLRKDYKNIDFQVTRNQTQLLDYAVANLFQSLLWGISLSFLIMFLFLKNLKAPILISIVIPISMIICLLFFQVLHISINIISLSGLVLGIGLMIDNSIIVIDNITQYYEQNNSLTKSCVLGTNEVFRPLLSSALTTCAVFIPLVFIKGIAGALFYDQAMAISIGLFSSLLVSILLLPVLYYLLHKRNGHRKGKITIFLEKSNTIEYERVYEKGLRWVLRNQKTAWSIIVFLLISGIVLYNLLPKSQLPYLSQKETLLKIDWNEQVNVDENKNRVIEVLAILKKTIRENTALVGSQQFILDKEALARTSEVTLYLNFDNEEYLDNAKQKIEFFLNKKYPNAHYKYKEVTNIFSTIFSNLEAPLIVQLKNVGSVENQRNNQLKEVWYQVQQNLNTIQLKPILWQESILLIADREKMMTYNINENSIYNKLKSTFGEREVFTIKHNQEIVPVVLGEDIKTIQDILNETTVALSGGVQVCIKEFLRVHNIQELKNISGNIEGEYYPLDIEVPDNKVIPFKNKIKALIKHNQWYEVGFSGSFFSNQEMVKDLIIILLLSLVLLYFILASQFESFILPIIILFEVPIDLTGAFLLLYFFGMSINLMSLIGIVVMCGIIINDSILKIDTIIQLQKSGASVLRAISVAGKRRLKPILMTSLTTILALVPMLFSSGVGVELQAPLAVALIGGMILGTIVSLYFIPLCYYYLISLNMKSITKFKD